MMRKSHARFKVYVIRLKICILTHAIFITRTPFCVWSPLLSLFHTQTHTHTTALIAVRTHCILTFSHTYIQKKNSTRTHTRKYSFLPFLPFFVGTDFVSDKKILIPLQSVLNNKGKESMQLGYGNSRHLINSSDKHNCENMLAVPSCLLFTYELL